ncbi:MAG: amidohydrolase family protein, partial [Anaerolineae bacterium]|nr:amidohydrolase family protein [Anaerolineae bacterium]
MKLHGMVDPHVHLRDLAWAHKATFASETAAALAGGYWAVFDMPNTPPTATTRAALTLKQEALSNSAVCDWGVYFGAAQQDNWHEYGLVSGICGLKMYNNATTGSLLIQNQAQREQHYQHWPADRVIAVHAEGQTVLEILALVRKYRKWTHFCHISTAEEITYLKAAKEEGLPVSIGVTPHHLYLTDADTARLGTLALMKPELKSKNDQNSLWEAVRSGLIDVIESDHAPHTLDEKLSAAPAYGVPGLETTLPLMVTAVREGRLSAERLLELLTVNVHRI